MLVAALAARAAGCVFPEIVADGPPADDPDGAVYAPPIDSSACPDPPAPASGGCTALGACVLMPIASAPPVTTPTDIRSYPFGMAVDETHVYWAAQDDYDGGGTGAVWRVPKDGGEVEQLTDPHPGPHSLVIDSKHVYWVAWWDASIAPPRILRLTRGQVCASVCPTPEPVFQANAGERIDEILMIGDERLFVLGATGHYRLEFDGTTWQRSTDLPGGPNPTGAFDGQHVYTWVEGDEYVYRTNPNTLAREVFINVPAASRRVGAGCNSVFLATDQSALEITDGGSRPLGAIAPGTTAIRVDSMFVYFSMYNAGGIFRTRRDAPTADAATQLAQANVWGLTLDADAIYFGEHQGGTPGAIFRITK
jgi:hypothetical protein